MKKDLLDELKKSHDSIESDPFGMFYLDIWEIGREVGSLGYLTRKEQSEYGMIYGRLRSYLLLVEEYNRIQMSGIFHGTKGIINRNQKDLLKKIEDFLDSHEALTLLEKIWKRLGR